MKPPEPNYTTDVYITRIIDGDTIQVEIIKRLNIRLLGIDADEKNTEQGKIAKKFLQRYLQKMTNYFSKPVRLSVPLNDPLTLMDFNSFNRVLGEIWVGEENLSDVLMNAEMAEKYEK